MNDSFPNARPSSPPSSGLDRLLMQSNNLLQTDEHADEPTSVYLSKNLDSIFERSKKLGYRISRTTGRMGATGVVHATGGPSAHRGELLLGSKGVNVNKYKSLLKKIDLATTFEPLQPMEESDVQGYLKHENNMVILTAIEETKKLTSNGFYAQYGDYMDMEWKKAKQQLIQSYRSRKEAAQREIYSEYQSPGEDLFNERMFSRRGRSNMDNRMKEYATAVYQLNQMNMRNEYFPIVHRFMQCAEAVQERDTRKREVINSWDILRQMIREPEIEARGMKQTLDKHAQQRELLSGARHSLELHYARFMEDRVAATDSGRQFLLNSRNQNGGKLDGVQLVRAFHETHRNANMSGNGISIWAQIYYCLRCGFRAEARELMRQIPDAQSLIHYLDNGNQSQSMDQDSLHSDSTDPFKVIVTIVLTSDSNHNHLNLNMINTADDYVWLKLSTLRGEPALKVLQKSITDSGPNHFGGRFGALLYFKLLLLTLQFEDAVHYLCTRDVDGYQVEAVHFAIALQYYGILNLTQDPKAPLLITSNDDSGKRFLNFNFLIGSYVNTFAHTDPCGAVSYFNLIQDSDAKLRYLKELVVRSKDPSALVGYIDRNGQKKSGCCVEFLHESQIFELLFQSAQEYEQIGRYSTAVDMYIMAEKLPHPVTSEEEGRSDIPAHVLKIVNSELSQVLIDGERRLEVVQMAKKTIKILSDRISRDHLFDTSVCLLRLANFFDLVNNGNWPQAIHVMESTALLPLQSHRHGVSFKDLNDTIKSKIADIVLATFIVVYNLFKDSVRAPDHHTESRKWKSYAERIIAYSATIDLPNEVNQKILRMSMEMK